MPAGCEFICQNHSCKCFNNGFNLVSPWPMGKIGLVLNAPNVRKNPKFREGLIRLKNEGRPYACITYPNLARIKIEAYRIEMWSKDAKCRYQFDLVVKDNKTVEDLINESNTIPSTCPKTNGKLYTFEEATKIGINCPHCDFPLRQDRWFTNED